VISELIEGLRVLTRYGADISSGIDEIVVSIGTPVTPDDYADLVALGWDEHQGEWTLLL